MENKLSQTMVNKLSEMLIQRCHRYSDELKFEGDDFESQNVLENVFNHRLMLMSG